MDEFSHSNVYNEILPHCDFFNTYCMKMENPVQINGEPYRKNNAQHKIRPTQTKIKTENDTFFK